mmetsp:Transcript_54692/g.122800  ORF Transcript_54692/g.122800 Transcript_54692/m.122800 type:complete len:342 (-) Transcript_54692:7-1032(-)
MGAGSSDLGNGISAEDLMGQSHAGACEPLSVPFASLCQGGGAAGHLWIYESHHAHGFFSMFSLVMGWLDALRKDARLLLVDWSSPDLLYSGRPGEPNIWTCFFKQPAELEVPREAIFAALHDGDVPRTTEADAIFGNYAGVADWGGTVSPALAAHGRALCEQWVELTPAFEMQLADVAASLFQPAGLRWLAVHIRRQDKHIESDANFAIGEGEMAQRIRKQCDAWMCKGVFLCSDDPKLKRSLRDSLSTGTLRVAMYEASLTESGEGVHFDSSLDGYKKAEDIVTETLLMARACHGLLSTYSNVSASAVYLSPPGYPYCTFWQSIPPAGGGSASIGALSRA